jgi:hypothetical protein
VGFGASDRANLTLLQRPEELDLEGGRNLADFVQENGPTIRALEETGVILNGTGESAARWPKSSLSRSSSGSAPQFSTTNGLFQRSDP